MDIVKTKQYVTFQHLVKQEMEDLNLKLVLLEKELCLHYQKLNLVQQACLVLVKLHLLLVGMIARLFGISLKNQKSLSIEETRELIIKGANKDIFEDPKIDT